MRAPKIIALVKAIALSHGIKVDKLHVGYAAAMVLHGILTETDYIELFVDAETWSEMSKWHKPMFDSEGSRLLLPNGVIVKGIDTLDMDHSWDTRSEVLVADLESLEASYTYFVAKQSVYRRALAAKDVEYSELVRAHISRTHRLRHDSKCAELKGYAQVILGIPCLMDILAMAKGLKDQETLVTEVKSPSFTRWEIKLSASTLSVKELPTDPMVKGAHHYIYQLDNIHRLVQE